MTFSVDPAAVDTFAAQCKGLAPDLASASSYVSGNTRISHGEAAMFAHVAFINDGVRDTVTSAIGSAKDVMTACGRELSSTARLYRHTDKATASRMDGTYKPAGTDAGLDEAVAHGSAASYSDPTGKLVAPVSEQPIPSLADAMLSFPDYVSPGHWLLWAIEKVCGTNPAEKMAEAFTGDWEAVARAASAYDHAGEFFTALASDIRTGAGTMLGHWEGNAASACEAYMATLAEALESGPAAGLADIAHQLKAVAFGIFEFAKMIVSLLEQLLDALIEAAVAAAAAAASSWTIVGGLIGGGVAAERILSGIRLFNKIMDAHSLALNLANGTAGLVAGGLGNVRGFDSHPLPGGYDHPGAA